MGFRDSSFPWRASFAFIAIAFGLGGSACSTKSLPAPRLTGPSNVAGPKELLPADLDVVLWIDLKRAKQLWLRDPERQLLRLLREYGVFPATDSTDELAFGIEVLTRADRLWIACRPHGTGCQDPVVLLRGDYNRFPLRKWLAQTNPGLDLGGGWLRYDRDVTLERSGLRRIYLAPPDRLLLVSTTELDAVERSLERSRGTRDPIPKEVGLVSLLVRPSGIARVLEKRSPAAARWLREARMLELQVLPQLSGLEIVIHIRFETQTRAERAAAAFRVLWTLLAARRNDPTNGSVPVEVLGDALVLRLGIRAPDPGMTLTKPVQDPTESSAH